MENFDYYNPVRMLFGNGQIDQLAEQIKPYGHRILLVYGQHHAKQTGLYEKITDQLKKAGLEWVELEGVHPNPRYKLVETGIELVREHKLDFVLGVGGGSVSDTAKAIAVGAPLAYDVWDVFEDFNRAMHNPNYAVQYPVGEVLPFAIVMTKAGTGSEFDYTSVLSRRETKEKLMVINKSIYANFCIDDPSLTFSLPQDETVFGVADIMTHYLEQYLSPSVNTLATDRIKEGLLRTVIESGRRVLENPKDYDARAYLLYAAAWACCDQNMCGSIPEWSSHLIEHELTALTDLNHGHGMALIYSGWMPQVQSSIPSRFVAMAENVWQLPRNGRSDEAYGQAAIEATKEYWRDLGINLSLSASGVDTSLIPTIAERTLRFGAVGSAKALDKEAIITILTSVE